MRYILVDTMNLFYRVRHTLHPHSTLNEKLGMSIHTMLSSANRVVNRSRVDHVVFALEGEKNWRKSSYEPYKKHRLLKLAKRTEAEVEEDELYFKYFNEMLDYLKNKTNCSLISSKNAEADDVIARFIMMHPDDEHVILSSDTDYYQLISDKVTQYNGITRQTITLDGFFDDNDDPVLEKKTNLPKLLGDPKWALFEKCIRGDTSDNIFSAFPGVRKKSTKNKVGLIESFADKETKGYNWNNLMLQRWADPDGVEHKVGDDYERNRLLIDLEAQPANIKDEVDTAIVDRILIDMVTVIPAKNIGFSFIKFCGKNDLVSLAESANGIVNWLAKPYNGVILNIMEEIDNE